MSGGDALRPAPEYNGIEVISDGALLLWLSPPGEFQKVFGIYKAGVPRSAQTFELKDPIKLLKFIADVINAGS